MFAHYVPVEDLSKRAREQRIRKAKVTVYLMGCLKPVTIVEVCHNCDMPPHIARPILRILEAEHRIQRKCETFWNGQYYANRYWYW